ncbi:MAG: peptide deformylase [Tatlockia sp.]|nr:peptide deformylase [Tatlockia sp.]
MPKIKATESMQGIFNEFADKIVNPNYYPNTAIETLKSRMTALCCLGSDDSDLVTKASTYIKRTSTMQDNDLHQLKSFAASIKEWRELEICSVYKNDLGSFVEYKLSVITAKGKELIHRHALYNEQEGKCYFVSQSLPLVRVIGDPVLHRPGELFPAKPSALQLAELNRQIEVARAILVETSGAGIAGNQCATIESPYRFAIVGVFKENQAHVQGVAKRYPGVRFPDAVIMVNPVIVDRSEKMQNFKHACLSVPSPNRCEVQSPQELTVNYLDPNQDMAQVCTTLTGIDAVALWHEMNHIIEGKTYIDTALATLKPIELAKFRKIIFVELLRRSLETVIPDLTVPPFYFTIVVNKEGQAQLDEAILKEVLPKFTNETLIGFLKQSHSISLEVEAKATKKSIEAAVKLSLFSKNPRPEDILEELPIQKSRL